MRFGYFFAKKVSRGIFAGKGNQLMSSLES